MITILFDNCFINKYLVFILYIFYLLIKIDYFDDLAALHGFIMINAHEKDVNNPRHGYTVKYYIIYLLI